MDYNYRADNPPSYMEAAKVHNTAHSESMTTPNTVTIVSSGQRSTAHTPHVPGYVPVHTVTYNSSNPNVPPAAIGYHPGNYPRQPNMHYAVTTTEIAPGTTQVTHHIPRYVYYLRIIFGIIFFLLFIGAVVFIILKNVEFNKEWDETQKRMDEHRLGMWN